jgi:FimV-like protein
MRLRRCLAAVALASFSLTSFTTEAQVGSTHEVRRGDTLFAVARKAKHDGVSRNQMILAIWRANQGAFPGGNINLLEVGTLLTIPPRDAVAGLDSTEADRLVRELLAPRPATQVAVARPAAVPPPPKAPAKPAAGPVGPEDAAKRYREGLALERKGDDQGALKAYLEAGEAGNGLAQRKLGQIYDKGNTAVQRDYQASLKWYQKAREQGVDIDKPLPRMTTK